MSHYGISHALLKQNGENKDNIGGFWLRVTTSCYRNQTAGHTVLIKAQSDKHSCID